ncbi:hypothetical protein UFOVP33_62 [uncultured Caudovirales phage]|uniref:Terminase small subunit n=1 Tax=uncultured Caudovirales phage TaxID=2100421 RepID=A0A6J5KNW3_9CAUD|nr:hypothetical protein UFOVP33_62 [uncultured Caudovirales phage]
MTSIKQELKDIEKEIKRKPGVAKANREKKTGVRIPPKILTDDNLTPAQEAYCRARALGMGKGESLNMAGIHNGRTSSEWERIPAVRERIAELCEIATKNSILKSGLDRGWVISRLMTITERCMQAEPVLDREGEPTGEYKFDSSGANKALELLGKTLKMWNEKDKEQDNEYANLSDDDIARIAAELATETGLIAHIAGAEAPQRPQQVVEVQALQKAD